MRTTLFFIVMVITMTGCSGTATQQTSGDTDVQGRFDLYVLGSAQDGGLPHVGCEKPCCVNARATGRVETPACLGIHDRHSGRLVLVEATPAVESQLATFYELTGVKGRGRQPVDAVLITHAHIGHYAGLIQFGREVASTREMPTYVTPSMAGFLRDNGPWSQLVELGQLDLVEITPGKQRFEPIEGLEVEAIAVPHREEFSDTVAFRFHGPEQTVLFCPDIDRWTVRQGLLEGLLEGVDVAYLDGTFYDGRELPGRNIADIPHPPIVDTMDRLAEDAKERPGRIRFLHINHSNPVYNDEAVIAEVEARGFGIARTGEKVDL
ncbi:MAG: MBL fold metallo-hydrolase [Phycisphaerales bacterium]|nr:MBL fold metallo-hydrolase [Phycisphaerales bacterium]